MGLLFLLVIWSIPTHHDHISGLSLLTDNSIVICASERFTMKLVKYNLQTGGVVHSTRVAEPPFGMTEIQLGRKHCLALSFGYGWLSQYSNTPSCIWLLQTDQFCHVWWTNQSTLGKESGVCVGSPIDCNREAHTCAQFFSGKMVVFVWINCTF